MLHTSEWRTMSFVYACNTSIKETKPQFLRNSNDRTLEDLFLSNGPIIIVVDDFRGYSLERCKSVCLISYVRFDAWRSAYLSTSGRKVGGNDRCGGQETTILRLLHHRFLSVSAVTLCTEALE